MRPSAEQEHRSVRETHLAVQNVQANASEQTTVGSAIDAGARAARVKSMGLLATARLLAQGSPKASAPCAQGSLLLPANMVRARHEAWGNASQ